MHIADNDHSYWKTFKDNSLTHSSAHYLHAIAQLLRKKGYARVTDVARQMEITKAAASQGITLLKARGYVLEDEARMLSLSEDGDALVQDIEENFYVISALFTLLGIDEEVGRADACKMEHLLSAETRRVLGGFVEALQDEPGALRRLRAAMDEPVVADRDAPSRRS